MSEVITKLFLLGGACYFFINTAGAIIGLGTVLYGVKKIHNLIHGQKEKET